MKEFMCFNQEDYDITFKCVNLNEAAIFILFNWGSVLNLLKVM